jgi:glycosyl transferase family 25
LASATQRRAFQQAQAERLGFEPIWHPAVGVDDMSDAFFLEHAFSWQRPLKKTEVGCFMSHYQLWQRIAQSDGPAVVLEDDVVLGGQWLDDIRTLEKLNSIDCICLETWNKKIISKKPIFFDGLQLHELFMNSAGAAGYMLWPSGAKILLNKFNIDGAGLTDAFINQTKELKFYQLVPANVVQVNVLKSFDKSNNELDLPSLIHREGNPSPSPSSNLVRLIMRLKRIDGEFKKFSCRFKNLFGGKRVMIQHNIQQTHNE